MNKNLLTPQPDPQAKGQVVYDRLAKWLDENYYSDKMKNLCRERYEQGLEKYGQPLMSDDGRDTASDVVQEFADAQIYLMKGIMQGKISWYNQLYELTELIEAFLFKLENPRKEIDNES